MSDGLIATFCGAAIGRWQTHHDPSLPVIAREGDGF